MKKAIKLIAAITVLAMALMGISGCGASAGRTEDGKVKIKIANAPDKNTDKVAYDSWQKSADIFMEKNSDIAVIAEPWAYDVQTFIPKAEGGTLATLYAAHFTEGKKIIEFGYSADMTDFLKKNGDYDKLNPVLLPNITDKNGDVYLLPGTVYTLGIIMNMKLMRQAGLVNEDDSPMVPKTFDELAEMAKTITEKTGVSGFVFPTTGNGGGWTFNNVGWAYGGDFITKDDNGKWNANLDSNEIVSAMEWLKNMKWGYNCMPASTLVNNADTMKMVGTDQAAMAIGHPGQLAQLIANFGMDLNDIAMVQIPAGPAKHVALMGGSYYAIANNASEEQVAAVYKWLEFKGATSKLTDEVKQEIERENKANYDEGKTVIGIKDLSVWNEESEVQAFRDEMCEKYRNVPIGHVASYNDKEGLEFQTEEEVCAQDMYSILDSIIQIVLTEPDADCRELLKEGNDKLQRDFLDHEE